MTTDSTQKFGFVAIVGETNAGKSTLVNQIVGSKVSIVSPKIQTTRRRILGVYTKESIQFVLIDTPGIFIAKRTMEQAMIRSAKKALNDADIVVVVVDTLKYDFETCVNLIQCIHRDLPVVLAINKIDKIEKKQLLKVAAQFQKIEQIKQIFMISALKGEGVKDLIQSFSQYLPKQSWVFDPDQVTDLPTKIWAAEITREQLYLQLQHELPYETYVETESFELFHNSSIKMRQVIYVSRDSQKAIVLGKKGQQIKSISEHARKELERYLKTSVHLFLFVKVAENWMQKLTVLRAMGHLDDNF